MGDEWRVRPNFTLNLGVRYETQTNIHDRRDLAPRLAFAWAPGGRAHKRAKTVLRAGFGIFYDRFALCNTLAAQRFNGLVQQQFVVPNPDFFPNVPSPADTLGVSDRRRSSSRSARACGRRTSCNPRRHAGAPAAREHDDGRDLYELARAAPFPFGRHQRAVAGHLQPGSGEQRAVSAGPSRAAGVDGVLRRLQPEPGDCQRQLEAERRALTVRLLRVQPRDEQHRRHRHVPGEPLQLLRANTGRQSTDVRHRFTVGGSINLKWAVRISPFVVAQTGAPFDITAGSDLYGTTLFNGRPGSREPTPLGRG